MNLGTILIRADASVAMGTGHVMRCLALAQAWQDSGGEVVFAMAESTPAIVRRLAAEGFQVCLVPACAGTNEDANGTTELAHAHSAKWIVVDGYSFDGDYQYRIKDAGWKLLCVDDNADRDHFLTDIVLNQNVHARASLYRQLQPGTRLLLGPKFAMLRREFNAWRSWRREVAATGRRVLVTMGGSDPDNLTALAIQALCRDDIAADEVIVVAGGSNPYIAGLRAQAESMGPKFRLEVDAQNMPELMAWADWALSSAGSTCWEMCMLGLPAIVIDAAPNQVRLAQEFACRKVAMHIPRARLTVNELAEKIQLLVCSSQLRSNMSKRARGLVDGQGAARVVAAMQAPAITLRRAQEEDCRLLWEWAADPRVRAASFSQAPITWEQHQVWFRGKMSDPRCLILIGENEQSKPLGQFRIDLQSEQDCEVDVSVSREHRGISCGSCLIDLGVREVFARTRAVRVHAFIRPENQASIRAFEDACFARTGEEPVKGQVAIHYLRLRDEQQPR